MRSNVTGGNGKDGKTKANLPALPRSVPEFWFRLTEQPTPQFGGNPAIGEPAETESGSGLGASPDNSERYAPENEDDGNDKDD
jgi:hypothetical protein